jgi:phage shock protein A
VNEHKEVISTIDSTRDEITQLQEDIQQTEQRRRELDMEKKKLEEEIEKYTSTKKQGKQPSNKRQKQERTSRSSIFSNRSGKGSDAGGRPSAYSIKGKQKRDIVQEVKTA